MHSYCEELQSYSAHYYARSQWLVHRASMEDNEGDFFVAMDTRDVAANMQEEAKRIWLRTANMRGLFD